MCEGDVARPGILKVPSPACRQVARHFHNKQPEYYPHIIDRIAADPVLAPRVRRVHLSVSDFNAAMYNGQDFSALKELPNLHALEVTYAGNTDGFMPIMNSLRPVNRLKSSMRDGVI